MICIKVLLFVLIINYLSAITDSSVAEIDRHNFGWKRYDEPDNVYEDSEDVPDVDPSENTKDEPTSEENDRKQDVITRPVYDVKNAPELFKKFIKDYNKTYNSPKDYNKHYDIFVKNLEEINELNKGGGSATFSINEFTDLGDDEFYEE